MKGNNMNGIEITYDKLRYDGLSPRQVKHCIKTYIDNKKHYYNDWKDVDGDGSLISLQVMDTHFFKIYVYYTDDSDSTIMQLMVKNQKYIEKIREHYFMTSRNLYTIYGDNMTESEFMDEFMFVYDDMFDFCVILENKENFPYTNEA